MTVPEQTPAGRDWDAFEAQVAAHKVAVARVVRVEDQLIDLMRAHKADLPIGIAERYTAALREARERVWATGNALFSTEEVCAAQDLS